MAAAMSLSVDRSQRPPEVRLRTPALDELSLRFVIESRRARQPVLDFGCAEGIAAAAALARGAHVFAIDSDEAAIQQLLMRVPSQHHRRLRARVADLLQVEFQDNSFGAIHVARVLQSFDTADVEATLRKFFRWLHPGGKLYVSLPAPALECAEQFVGSVIGAAGFSIEQVRCYPLPWNRDQLCCSAIARCAL